MLVANVFSKPVFKSQTNCGFTVSRRTFVAGFELTSRLSQFFDPRRRARPSVSMHSRLDCACLATVQMRPTPIRSMLPVPPMLPNANLHIMFLSFNVFVFSPPLVKIAAPVPIPFQDPWFPSLFSQHGHSTGCALAFGSVGFAFAVFPVSFRRCQSRSRTVCHAFPGVWEQHAWECHGFQT